MSILQGQWANHPIQTWQEALWLSIALLTPLFVNLWVEQQFEASKIWLLRTLVWLLVMLWLSGWAVGQRTRGLPVDIRASLVALALTFILSTLFSANRYIAIFGTLHRANGVLTQLSYLLLFVCVATQIDSQLSQRLLHLIVLTALPICLLGLAQVLGWQPLPLWSDARSAAVTTLGRANFTGAYLALLLPLTLAATQGSQGWQRRGFGALMVLELLVIALTQARSAWIAALFGTWMLWWLRAATGWSHRRRWISVLGSFCLMGSGLLLILQRGIVSGGSIAARWTIWQAALRLLQARPWLGYGADTLELHFPAVYPPQLVYYQGRGVVVDRAHSWLLDWSLSHGVVGTLVFAALVYLVLRMGWQRLSHLAADDAAAPIKERNERRWLAACMAAIGAQLVGNLFLFEVAATAVIFWLLMAIVVAASLGDGWQAHSQIPSPLPPLRLPLRQAQEPGEGPPSPRHPQSAVEGLGLSSRTKLTLAVIAVFMLSWLIGQSNVRPLLADLHSWRGTQALGQGEGDLALMEYATAVRYQPRRAEYHVAMALTTAQMGDFLEAERSMQNAIALRPTDPVLHAQLAAIYASEAGQSAQMAALAHRAYEQAIALAPTIALTHRQYADFALRTSDPALARTLAQRAVALDATDGVAFGILGWSSLHEDDPRAAQAAFVQAIKWQPDSADFYLGLATTHFQQGNFAAAREAVEQSLLLNPTYQPALTLQVQLEQ